MQRFTWIFAALLSASTALAGDWPQFLGPNRDAVSSETDLNLKWPASGPKPLWSVDVGPGFGGASIKDGRVFILDRKQGEADFLRVLDLKTGKDLWKFEYAAEGRHSYNGSRSVPTVTDTHVYTVGGFGDVHCIDRKTHKPVWHFNLGKRFTEGDLKWGYAQSPLVYKNTLILTPTSAKTPSLVAVELKTGKTVWESETPNMKPARDSDTEFNADYYNSPVLRTVAGEQGVMLVTNHQVLFVRPDTGKTIWKYNGYAIKFSIPSPTVLSDGRRIFVTGGYDCGSVMIKVTKAGSDYKIEELFRLPTDGSQLHPAVEHDGKLYANINENTKIKAKAKRPTGGLACIDPDTGKIVWRTGAEPFFERGALLKVGGGKLLILDGEKGTLTSVEASPEGFKPIASAKVLDDKTGRQRMWAPMALADGLLVIRDQSGMKCLDLRKANASAE